MPLTPETLTRHELNGLHVEVVDAANPDLVGIAGRIVVETMRTLQVDTGAAEPRRARDGDAVEHGGARVRQVPKEGTTFEFRLPAVDAAGERAGSTLDTDTDTDTDEAAGVRKAPGTASELVSTPTESAGDAGAHGASVEATRDGAGEGVAYVTVDGTRLLSRPALRTENAGESTWR